MTIFLTVVIEMLKFVLIVVYLCGVFMCRASSARRRIHNINTIYIYIYYYIDIVNKCLPFGYVLIKVSVSS